MKNILCTHQTLYDTYNNANNIQITNNYEEKNTVNNSDDSNDQDNKELIMYVQK